MAYKFWLALEEARVDKGMSKLEVADRANVARTTIDNLKTSTRAPLPRIVHSLADAVGMSRTAAAELAGLIPARPTGDSDDVRAAIANSSSYSDDQKAMLLSLVDVLDEANVGRQQGAPVNDSSDQRDRFGTG